VQADKGKHGDRADREIMLPCGEGSIAMTRAG
jgi:hypothetical protein